MERNLPLHVCHIKKSSAIINRSHTLLNFTAVIALIYYRAFSLLQPMKTATILPHLLVFASELILSLIWLLGRAFRWRPVSRAAFPERLPEEEELPALDVFICTADPEKEPTVEVMNTVVSAMALDYPTDKLHVYVSDDGGCPVTLLAMREAWRFARWWVPFCRGHGIQTRCPQAYFGAADVGDDHLRNSCGSSEFLDEKEKLKEKYGKFKENLMRIRENSSIMINQDHSPVVEVINDSRCKSVDEIGAETAELPLLVYVSREKRPSHPHHFKAGALNVLLRVSAMLSNSPYILVLDCDMYCNDPSSALQAMCFHLDPNLSSSLAFVQFPQKFHNISKFDIYDSQMRSTFKVEWPGMDGIQGPCLSGSGFYMKRKALYENPMKEGVDMMEVKKSFGPSNEFISKSFGQNCKPSPKDFSSTTLLLLKETQFLASCSYENDSKWGKEVGFLYFSVLEDYFTELNLHCNGWTSVYFDPSRPAFLGTGTTNLNDLLIQGTRWRSGMVEVGISSFSPLIYGLRKKMSFCQGMCYAQLALHPFYFLPLWCLATFPQLCLLNGIPLYPEVSNWSFIVFSFIFVSSHFNYIQEILSSGGSLQTWINEQRIWMIMSVTCHMYGTLDAVMTKIGIREANFLPTNKVDDDEQLKHYKMGIFDFQTSTMFLVPMVTLVTINLVSLIGGVARAVAMGSLNEVLGQVILSLFIVTVNCLVIEGMVRRKDKGRIPSFVNIVSTVISVIFLLFGSLLIKFW